MIGREDGGFRGDEGWKRMRNGKEMNEWMNKLM